MKNSIPASTCLTLLAIILLLPAAGCQNGKGIRGVDNCAEIPCGAIPAPPGTNVYQWQETQVGKASLDQGVFYQADFVSRTSTLAPAARKKRARMIRLGTVGSIPAVERIEATDLARVASN